MKINSFKKGIVLGIIIIFIGAIVFPSTIGTINEKKSFTGSKSRGHIQNLIDNASNGDTIFIPSGTYYENIIIDKSISLIGEDKANTIIDGSGSEEVVSIVVDWVNISDLSIQNGDIGIEIQSDHNTVVSNFIRGNTEEGIFLLESSYNEISDNNISENEDGIELEDSGYNIITNNTISLNNDYGLEFQGSSKDDYIQNMVYYNTFSFNNVGILLINSSFNLFTKNNFLDNSQNAFFNNCKNSWKQNYWDRSRILPKLIFGKINIGSISIPWINIDFRPAKAPYEI